MYQVGDFIFYGSTGVCKILDIIKKAPESKEKARLYYKLDPLYQNCTIFTPVHEAKVFMRPIISKEEAEHLIDTIPSIQAKAYYTHVSSQLAGYYEESLKTHRCIDLVRLTLSIYAKKRAAQQQNRKFGAVDQRFMKRAEELLFGELAAALSISIEEVPEYISRRVRPRTKETK
ncbi:MAG: CarD family transcriptional regulator [Oscillospiraceae bacterium]|nr:CarD family transcriptional regulator [Oscillospiraceae bacterium]